MCAAAECLSCNASETQVAEIGAGLPGESILFARKAVGTIFRDMFLARRLFRAGLRMSRVHCSSILTGMGGCSPIRRRFLPEVWKDIKRRWRFRVCSNTG